MNIYELAAEYSRQYDILSNKIDGLRPLLYVYTGEDLYLLRKRIKTYYDMAYECKRIAGMLAGYYED